MAERRRAEAWEDPVAATREKLKAWGVTDDPRAAVAMTTARKLKLAKGGGAASLSRELRQLLADLRAIPREDQRPGAGPDPEPEKPPAVVDPVDEIKQARERRLRTAGGEA